MKARPILKDITLILIFIIISLKLCLAQNPDSTKILVLSPKVGKTIDFEEKDEYKILPYLSTNSFDSAQFLQLHDSSVVLRIWTNDSKTTERPTTYDHFLYTRKIIDGNTVISKLETDSIIMITLKDGNKINGKLIEKRETEIEIETEALGRITIPLDKIDEMKGIKSSTMKDGKYWFPNPHPTRYLFSPSAYNLKKGEGYYQNTYVLLHSFNVGITDNISIGGGLEAITTLLSLSGEGGPIFFITPKIGYEVKEKVNVGGGILYANLLGTGSGIAYGIGTYGTKEHNITAGLGWGFVDGEFSSRPIMTISAMTRIGKSVSLVTENWFIPFKGTDYEYDSNFSVISQNDYYYYYAALSGGLRIMSEKFSVDLAGIILYSEDFYLPIPIPYIDLVYKF